MAHLVAPGRLEHPARAEPPEKSVSYMVLAWFLHVLYMLIYVASFAHGFECFACVCVSVLHAVAGFQNSLWACPKTTGHFETAVFMGYISDKASREIYQWYVRSM